MPPAPQADIPAQALDRINRKTKPPGSLGMLETVAVRLAGLQQSLEPRLRRKRICIYAGCHGVTAEGVSAYPREVTEQMVLNFLSGGAAINVLARHGAFKSTSLTQASGGRVAGGVVAAAEFLPALRPPWHAQFL